MKTSTPFVIATKRLSCKNRNFHLGDGTLVFLKNASQPMIQWLQEIHTNDAEALQGDIDVLMGLYKSSSKQKRETQTPRAKKPKKQLFFRLRPSSDS